MLDSPAENVKQAPESRVRTKPTAVFTDCSYEVICKIAEYCTEKEINHLAQQNFILYKWLNHVLCNTEIQTGESSAWFRAAQNGSLGTMKLLVNYGIDLSLTTDPESSYLRERPDGTGQYRNVVGTPFTSLSDTILDVASFLLKKGLDPEQKTSCSDPDTERECMELAIKNANPGMAMFLLGKGFGASPGSALRQKVFELALWHHNMPFAEHLLFLQILIKSGVNVKLPASTPPDTTGTVVMTSLGTVFRYYGWKSWAERIPLVLDLLIDNGIDIKCILHDHNGATTLHIASILGLTEYGKYFLDDGADIEAKDNFGRSPLAYATAMGSARDTSPKHEIDCWHSYHHYQTGELIQQRDHYLSWTGSIESINLLLDNGADSDAEGMYSEDITVTPEVLAAGNINQVSLKPQMLAAQNTNSSFRVAFANGLISQKPKTKSTPDFYEYLDFLWDL